MLLCEICQIRIRRKKHPQFINIEQVPPVHHFCSLVCKMLWIEFIRKTGNIPPTFIEISTGETNKNGEVFQLVEKHQGRKK